MLSVHPGGWIAEPKPSSPLWKVPELTAPNLERAAAFAPLWSDITTFAQTAGNTQCQGDRKEQRHSVRPKGSTHEWSGPQIP